MSYLVIYLCMYYLSNFIGSRKLSIWSVVKYLSSADSSTFEVKKEIWNLKVFYKCFTNGDMFHDLLKNGCDPSNSD